MDSNYEKSSKVRVLIVDDDINMARYLKDLLATKNCETTVYNDSTAALEHFRARHEEYDLVVSDICMPVMSGDCLAKEILEFRPDMPVILCSGYAPHIDKQKLLEMGVKKVMEKPVDTAQLLQLINEVAKK